MKLKDYNQMMSYLTRPKNTLTESMKKSEFVKEQKQKRIEENRINAVRKKYGLKPNQRPETMNERVDRLGYVYDDIGSKPKHMDNPNIVAHENLKPTKKIKKISPITPLFIDTSGIDVGLTALERPVNPTPVEPPKRPKKRSEGLAYLLGIVE